jgi:hypothetical protein
MNANQSNHLISVASAPQVITAASVGFLAVRQKESKENLTKRLIAWRFKVDYCNK